MQSLSERTAGFTDSVIRRMTRVSMQYDAVNLSQGFPDFEPPKELLDRLAQVAYEDYHQYSITWGSQNFREALAAKQTYFMGRRIDPNTEIVTTCGSTEAMMAAMMTVTNPGDKVIIFSPFYENYSADTILSGAEPIYVPLVPPDFHFDANVLEDAFRQHPKAIILCNPSNPCGKVFTREELEIIASLAEKYDTYVITDEVYEHICFAEEGHASVLAHPQLRERAIAVSSFGKTYHMTGWKVGYCVAPAAISAELRKVHQYLTFAVNTPAQLALADMLRSEPGHYRELPDFYRARRDRFVAALSKSRLEILPCEGTYFLLADYSAISDLDDVSFCQRLTKEVGVAAIPLSVFCADPFPHKLIRLCFAKQESTLLAAAARLNAL